MKFTVKHVARRKLYLPHSADSSMKIMSIKIFFKEFYFSKEKKFKKYVSKSFLSKGEPHK